MMNKLAKYAITTGVGAFGVTMALSELIYEYALNRKFTSKKNRQREFSPELYDYYGKPEEQTASDDWFIAMHPEDTCISLMDGNRLHAYIFEQPEKTDNWAFVVHGYTSCPRSQADQAMYFYRNMGYNVIMPCMRSYDKDEHTYCTMGDKDRYIVTEWVNYIVAKHPDCRIVLMGASMGSATVMLATGEPLPKNVKCAVADCGYSSVWDELKTNIADVAHVPAFPFLYTANIVSVLRGNLDFRKVRPVDAVAKSVTPTLFIHGENDTFVPYRMMKELYDACSAEKEKLSVPDAGHSESHEVHPEIYYPALDRFVRKYMEQ